MKQTRATKNGNSNALAIYLREVSNAPLLSDEEAASLGTQACAGDVLARERLVHSHLRLVVKIAQAYAGFGLPLNDLISEGNIGLLRATELYDPKFGTKFRNYASVWIKQRLHRAITKQARSVCIPVWRSQRLRKLAHLTDELSSQLGRQATDEDLAERLGLSTEQMTEMQSDRVEVVSLDAPLSTEESDGAERKDIFPDEGAVDPSAELAQQEMLEELMTSLHELDDRELEILSLKHGFHPQGAVSFRELGRRLGMSHEWVRRIAELAIVKARRAMEACAKLSRAERLRRRNSVRERLRLLAGGAVPA